MPDGGDLINRKDNKGWQCLFPVGCETNWQSASAAADWDPFALDWLLDSGSLTQRLKRMSMRFHVQLLGQGTASVGENERRWLHTRLALAREVLLCCDEIPVVFARTMIPEATVSASGGQLARWGCRSLGELLFSSPEIVRARIELGRFPKTSRVACLAAALGQEPVAELLGRRSCFFWSDQPLLVSEVFLPAAVIYRELSA